MIVLTPHGHLDDRLVLFGSLLLLLLLGDQSRVFHFFTRLRLIKVGWRRRLLEESRHPGPFRGSPALHVRVVREDRVVFPLLPVALAFPRQNQGPEARAAGTLRIEPDAAGHRLLYPVKQEQVFITVEPDRAILGEVEQPVAPLLGHVRPRHTGEHFGLTGAGSGDLVDGFALLSLGAQ